MAVFENLQELIDLLGDAPEVAELTFSRPGGAQITLKRPAPRASAPAPAPPVAAGVPAQTPSATSESLANAAQAVAAAQAAAAAAPPPAAGAAKAGADSNEIAADRVGVFHLAKPPLAPGDLVAAGQIVGYIEAIKLMNEVRAQAAGTITEQFAEEALPVEYGQPLFRMQPS